MASRTAPLSDDDKARILQLHAQGMTRNDIARETGRAAATVTRVVTAAGLTFDRTSTEAATKAKVKDAAARRADAQLAELEILELGQQMVLGVFAKKRKFKHIMKSTFGEEIVKDLDFIPGDQMQRLANSRSSSTTIITNLARLDADRGDEAVKSLLIGFAHKLGLVDEPVA